MEAEKPGTHCTINEGSRLADEEKRDSDLPAGEGEEEGEKALDDARALQHMIEGVPDQDEAFRRIEQKG